MNRRASLPGADELFRSTQEGRVTPLREGDPGGGPGGEAEAPAGRRDSSGRTADEPAPTVEEGASGRVRHDEKITVYLTSQELLDLEQARLRLRAEFGISADRGRIVREAIAQLLADLHERGPDSRVVRHLT